MEMTNFRTEMAAMSHQLHNDVEVAEEERSGIEDFIKSVLDESDDVQRQRIRADVESAQSFQQRIRADDEMLRLRLGNQRAETPNTARRDLSGSFSQRNGSSTFRGDGSMSHRGDLTSRSMSEMYDDDGASHCWEAQGVPFKRRRPCPTRHLP